MRRLAFGGPALEELKRGDLSGVTQLEELTVNANNLMRFGSDTYEPNVTKEGNTFCRVNT